MLIVLSDGRPYDHDYGDARYAREDTREALRQAKVQGITPFCITIDRESEAELKDLYGEIGYTIIDDVLTLPERLPGIQIFEAYHVVRSLRGSLSIVELTIAKVGRTLVVAPGFADNSAIRRRLSFGRSLFI